LLGPFKFNTDVIGFSRGTPERSKNHQTQKVKEMATTRQKIPVRVLPREEIEKEWEADIHIYEVRYEMSSEKMAALVELGAMRQTAEVIRWYHTYYAVKSYLGETPTTGTPGTTTATSTKPD
jgi:superfamily II DNA or RNA helicase